MPQPPPTAGGVGSPEEQVQPAPQHAVRTPLATAPLTSWEVSRDHLPSK